MTNAHAYSMFDLTEATIASGSAGHRMR